MGYTQKLGLLAQSVFQDSSLNVGIGAAPSGSYKLEVTGTGYYSGALTIGGANDGYGTLYVSALTSRNAARLRNDNASFATLDINNANASGTGVYSVASKNYFSGNVGIGTSSPSSFSGYTVASISGASGGILDLMYNGTSQLRISAESGANYISGVTNAPLYFYTNSALSLTLASSGAATFSSSVTAGGTIASTSSSGAIFNNTSITTNNAYIRLVGSAHGFIAGREGSAGGQIFTGASAYASVIGSESTDPLQFATNNTVVMTIASGGNVGIGGTPENKFNVFAGTGATFRATANGTNVLNIGNYSSASGFRELQIAASDLSFLTGTAGGGSTAERMRITSAGDMYLTGRSTNGDYGMYFYSNDTDSRIYSSNSGAISKPLQFYTSGTERMRINSSGYLQLSNTATYLGGGTGAYNTITSDNGAAGTLYIQNTSASLSVELVNIYASRNTTNNTFYALRYYNTGSSTAKFLVADSGNVTNTNNSYGAISDIKLKENIIDATPKLDDLLKVKIKNFNYIGSEEKQLGVIAQELEEVFPGMIEQHQDYKEVEVTDEEGNTTTEKQSLGTVTKSVKYSVFVPMLIKAMQEQQAQIEELKKIVALESK
jgi:hypothetical protein